METKMRNSLTRIATTGAIATVAATLIPQQLLATPYADAAFGHDAVGGLGIAHSPRCEAFTIGATDAPFASVDVDHRRPHGRDLTSDFPPCSPETIADAHDRILRKCGRQGSWEWLWCDENGNLEDRMGACGRPPDSIITTGSS